MPSTQLFGCRLRQLATDFMPMYFLTAVVQVVWLFIYWIGVVAFSQPEKCKPGTASGGQQYAMTFTLLGFFIAQAAACCAAALLSLRGTPLEPSKRRWVSVLSHAYLLSLPLNAGLLAWGGWVVEAGDGTCWSSGNKKMMATIVFGGIGVLLGQAVNFAMTYNMLCDVRRGSKLHALTRTQLSSVLHLVGGFRARYRGPTAQLEGLLTQLQPRLAGIDGEKTDAAAGLACAALLQREAAEAAGAADGPDSSSQLLAWAEQVCRGAVAPASAPMPATAADAEAAEEALHWARFATAAYGARQRAWRRGETGSCAASKQLSRLAAAAAADGAQPLAGWGAVAPGAAGAPRSAKPSRAQLWDFAAARELLGPGSQIVSLSAGRGDLLPLLVAVDREKKAVVLGIAGNSEWPHIAPDAVPAPAGWAASSGSAVVEAGGAAAAAGAVPGVDGVEAQDAAPAHGSGESWAHQDSLQAAQALLQELERSQVLQQLLQPAAGSGGALGGLDCHGWQIVLAGHGVGAGAAALLAPRLAGWHLGPVVVWAFGPPGELCSPDLATAIASCCRLTAVAVGDDAAPRTTTPAVAALVDQAVVGLARLRYPKMALLAALAGERLLPRRWRGRWVTPAKALRPLAAVPEEALGYLGRYHAWRQQEQVQEPRCGALPGRLLVLSRLGPAQPAAAAAGDSAEQAAAGAGSSSGSSCSGTAEHAWQATWVSGEAVAAWGIRASNHALADHYVSLLLGVLGELAQPGATSSRPASSAASEGESQQPLQPPAAHRDSRGHTHSD